MAVDNHDVRWFSMLGAILLAVLLYTLLPRYTVQTLGDEKSVSVIVYDKWTGRIQRAVYDNSGSLNLMGAFMPFQQPR